MSRCRERKGLDLTCCAASSRFPTKDLVPYDTAFLSGFVVEHYQVVLPTRRSGRSTRWTST